ncbi:50S ribosomal protein L32 [Streptosporangium sp. DT93]|uniref:50S ribosomal protein L32 n=1 Tax=Streptosporangium sp. DT93 TaxID=3393428 RepID=UPI003CF198CA
MQDLTRHHRHEGELVNVAVPKRRTSRGNTRHRRSQWKAVAPDLVPITVEGRELLAPRPLVRACSPVRSARGGRWRRWPP